MPGCQKTETWDTGAQPIRENLNCCCRLFCCRQQIDAIIKQIRQAEAWAGLEPGNEDERPYVTRQPANDPLRVHAEKFVEVLARHKHCLGVIADDGRGMVNDMRGAKQANLAEIFKPHQVEYLRAAEMYESSLDIDRFLETNAATGSTD